MSNIDPDSTSETGSGQQPADPTLQIKFTLIFGILALIPFVLFYFYGIENKPTQTPAGTNFSTPQVAFKDVTVESGISFSRFSGGAGEKLLPETMGSGCAFFDFDNDGDADLLLVNSAPWPWSKSAQTPPPTHALYQNDGSGNFRDVTAGSGLDVSSYGMGVAIADYDNDGMQDVFISGVHGNKLFRNVGQGHFQDVTSSAGMAGNGTDWSTSAAWLDYDRDGDLDLFVCNYVKWSREIDLAVYYQLPGIGRAYGPPMNFEGSFPYLYRNDGNGKFTEISANAGLRVTNKASGIPLGKSLGVVPVDLDNDGWLDLVVANDTVQNFVFHNNGNGTFTEIGGRSGIAYDKFGSTRGAMGIDAARIYDDSLAVSIGNFANEMTAFYVASRDPLFFTDQAMELGIGTPSKNLLTFGVFFFDYDLDGRLDLLTANGHIEPEIDKLHGGQNYAQPAQLFWNAGHGLGRGSFIPARENSKSDDLYNPLVGRGSAFADVDRDGDLDVIITQPNGPARLFRNEQASTHSWVRLQLRTSKGNRDALGATVRIRAGKLNCIRFVSTARGYLSCSELPITIGLGEEKKVDEIEVTWPDGKRQKEFPITLNSFNLIQER